MHWKFDFIHFIKTYLFAITEKLFVIVAVVFEAALKESFEEKETMRPAMSQ